MRETYLLRTYAQRLFDSVVYVNLESDRPARADFSGGLDPRAIVRAIESRTGQRIVPGEPCCSSTRSRHAGENTRSRSIASLRKGHPDVRLVRLSTKPFGTGSGLISVPLYAAFCL